MVDPAVEFRDEVYLPGRMTGDPQDRFGKLHVYIPEGEGPFPAIVFLHGGGGSRGRAMGSQGILVQRALEGGYVAAGLGYMLNEVGNGGTLRAWETKSALRYIRAHAERFKIDPGRIGARGVSARGDGGCARRNEYR